MARLSAMGKHATNSLYNPARLDHDAGMSALADRPTSLAGFAAPAEKGAPVSAQPVPPPAVDAEAVRRQHRFHELLTWPEINEAVAQAKVVVLPVGSVEQHGYHLPLDVDVKLASSVCLGAGERAPEEMLVLPPVSYGYCHHVMDFPGTINIEPTTFVRLLLDITRSVAYHGFKRIIIVNGHGSNHPLVEQAGRPNLPPDRRAVLHALLVAIGGRLLEPRSARVGRAGRLRPRASWRPRPTSISTAPTSEPIASAGATRVHDRDPRRLHLAGGRSDGGIRAGHDRRVDLDLLGERQLRPAGVGHGGEGRAGLRSRGGPPGRIDALVPAATGPAAVHRPSAAADLYCHSTSKPTACRSLPSPLTPAMSRQVRGSIDERV